MLNEANHQFRRKNKITATASEKSQRGINKLTEFAIRAEFALKSALMFNDVRRKEQNPSS